MTHINQRHDHVGAWISDNPVLMAGEVGWEIETRKSKLGDGVTAWNSLPYTQTGISATKADVGLSEVDNTSDMDKPVSTAQATALGTKADATATTNALNLKAPLASPTFTGDPKAPTPATSDNDTSIATTAFVQALVKSLVDQAGPIGTIKEWPGFVAPTNHLMLDGGAYLRATYPTLWNTLTYQFTGSISAGTLGRIDTTDTNNAYVGMPVDGPNIPAGTTVAAIVANTYVGLSANATGAVAAGSAFRLAPWGNGNGSTTFNVPDRRGVTGVGIDASAEFKRLNTRYGEKTHLLTTGEIPAHVHDQYVTANTGGSGVRKDYVADQAGLAPYPQGITTGNTGGGGAHNNIQPSVAMNYIIRAV